jgi:hypothetical protein
LHSYLADKRGPGAEHLTRIADYGIDVHWLLTGKCRPLVRLDYGGDVWPELAEKVGALPPTLVSGLFELSVELAEAFRGRRTERTGQSLSIGQSFSAFSFFYLMVIRLACQLVPLMIASTKAAPKSADVRSRIMEMVPRELDAQVENHLLRLF